MKLIAIFKFTLFCCVAIIFGAQAIEDRVDIDPNDELDPGEKISWKNVCVHICQLVSGGIQ